MSKTPAQLAIESLTEKQRYVIVAVYHEGYTEATVADWLGMTQSGIAKLLGRARAKLRRLGLPMPARRREVVTT